MTVIAIRIIAIHHIIFAQSGNIYVHFIVGIGDVGQLSECGPHQTPYLF